MKFEDLSLFAFMTMALQIMLGSVSLFRAIAMMHESTYEVTIGLCRIDQNSLRKIEEICITLVVGSIE